MRPEDVKQVVRRRNYKYGYYVLDEIINGETYECEDFLVRSAYTTDGDKYLGTPGIARFICKKMKIKPEMGSGNICNIGFCEKENAWYGWTHRAIAGFTIGDMIFDSVMCSNNEYMDFRKCGIVVIETMEQARQSALNFARYMR